MRAIARFGKKRLAWNVWGILLVAVALVAGCQADPGVTNAQAGETSPPPAPPAVNVPAIAGVWLGTIVSADSQNVGNTTLTVQQSNASIGGTWGVMFPGMTNGGTLKGSVTSAGKLDLTLVPSTTFQCPLHVGGTLMGDQFAGTYETLSCPYSLQGTVSMARQTPQSPTYTHAWPAGGKYDAYQAVTLTAHTLYPPATVYYTLDGSTPAPGQSATLSVASTLQVPIQQEGATVLRYMAVDNSGYAEPVREAHFVIGVAAAVQEIVFGNRKVFLPLGFNSTQNQPQGAFTGVALSANGGALAGFACDAPALGGEVGATAMLNGAVGRLAGLGSLSNIVTYTHAKPVDTVFAQYRLAFQGFATPMELSNRILGVVAPNILGGTVTNLPATPSSSPVDYLFRISLGFQYYGATSVVCLVSVVPEASYASLAGLVDGFGDGTNVGRASDILTAELETFNGTGSDGLADFLFVVDNSGSMFEEQQAVVQAGNAFFTAMTASGLDFRIGTITTDSDAVIGNAFSNSLATFQANIQWGINGSGIETGIYFAERALRSTALGDGFNGTVTRLGYPRPGASLSAVILSDEPDQYSTRTGTSFNVLNNLFVQRGYRVYAIVPPVLPAYSQMDAGQYKDLAAATGGATADIENAATFPAIMETIALHAGGASSSMVLAWQPVSFSIVVTVNGATVHNQSSGGWRYAYASNSLVFFGYAVPQAGDAISVRYQHITGSP